MAVMLRPEAALQPLAMEDESEPSLLVGAPGIVDRLPGALVPQHDGAAAILPSGYNALEASVFQGMVFDMNSEPFVGRIEAGAFGDRPALGRAVELEPEVVMQPGRVVLLDQIAQPACPSLADRCAFRLRGLREVALGMIALE
jgi:hypothetical protein